MTYQINILAKLILITIQDAVNLIQLTTTQNAKKRTVPQLIIAIQFFF